MLTTSFYRQIGKLAQQGDTFTTVFVEFELKRAIEWLTGTTKDNMQKSYCFDN